MIDLDIQRWRIFQKVAKCGLFRTNSSMQVKLMLNKRVSETNQVVKWEKQEVEDISDEFS